MGRGARMPRQTVLFGWWSAADSTAQACRGSSDVLPDTSKVMMSQLLF